jgi:type I restriction enzyme, S subunit
VKRAGLAWAPRTWPSAPLKRHFRVFGGSTPGQEAGNWDGDICWVTPADLSALDGFAVRESRRTITEQGLASCGTTLVPKNSLVLSTRAPIGSIGVAERTLCTNQGCKSLVPLAGTHSRFFAYVLSVSSEMLNALGRGSTFMELSGDDLGAFHVPAPAPDEQRRIAAFLDYETARIHELIRGHEQMAALLADRRIALAAAAVTGALTMVTGRTRGGPMWLGEVPDHWRVSRLGYEARIGNGSTPARTDERFWSEGQIPWLNSSKVNEREIWAAEQFVTEAAVHECHLPMVPANSLVVALTGEGRTRGLSAISRIDATVSQHLAYVVPGADRLSSEYLHYYFLASYQHLRDMSSGVGSTRAALTCDALQSFPVVVPPLGEQRTIVERLQHELDSAEDLLFLSGDSRSLLAERRSALITAAVTGHINVNSWTPPDGWLTPEAA